MTTELTVRLAELRLLKDNWLEGTGCAPHTAGIDWLCDKLSRSFPQHLPLPFLYPTPAGGIRLEWSVDPYDITLDIDLADHTANLHELNLSSDEDREERLNLDEPADWERLGQQIRSVAGGRS